MLEFDFYDISQNNVVSLLLGISNEYVAVIMESRLSERRFEIILNI